MSPSNERLLGYAIDDLVGQNGFDLVHPDDRSALNEAMERLIREPDVPVTIKHRFRTAGGTWRVLESTLLNRLDHPTLRGWVVHARDVTDRDALEGELEHVKQTVRRLQLHPHFVLNVLHTIQTELLSDPEAAAETIADFGDLLRLSYAHVDTAMVPLGHEIDFVVRYIHLYHHRFSSSIEATVDVPADARSVMVPSLLLQPVVENALLHGLNPVGGGCLAVRARRQADRLHLTVRDDGVGLDRMMRPSESDELGARTRQTRVDDSPGADGRGRASLGLSTTRTRLRQNYGTAATLQIDSGPEGGTVVTMTLPIETAPPPDDPPYAHT